MRNETKKSRFVLIWQLICLVLLAALSDVNAAIILGALFTLLHALIQS